MAESNPPAITSIAIQLRFMVSFSFSERPFFGRLVRIGRCTCLAELNLLKTIRACHRMGGLDEPGGGFQPIVGLKSIQSLMLAAKIIGIDDIFRPKFTTEPTTYSFSLQVQSALRNIAVS
jgi:hypothetical protein